MLRPTLLAALALFAAAPASAQVGSGPCQPHRHGEVRCAVRINIPGGNRRYPVVLHAARLGSDARMQADTYISTCGSAGVLAGRTQIGNSGASEVATFTNERNEAGMLTQALAGFCVEVFLLNCQANGQPISCVQAINLGVSRVEVR